MLLFETIRCKDGCLEQLAYHRERMQRSTATLFGETKPIDLEPLRAGVTPVEGVWKCRVMYGRSIERVEFASYEPAPVRRLALLADEELSYEHKYTDRSALLALVASRPEADDVIVVRRGLLTDASYANIALYDGMRWATPATPLLRGTRRERLLREGVLEVRDIRPADLVKYTRISLINAMLDLGAVEVPTAGILPF
jgi:4-amino-4-deoxychorismate lyase